MDVYCVGTYLIRTSIVFLISIGIWNFKAPRIYLIFHRYDVYMGILIRSMASTTP